MCVDCVRFGRGIYRCEACLHRRAPWLPRVLVVIHAFNVLVYATGLPILALRPYGKPVTVSPQPAKVSVFTMHVYWRYPHCRCSTEAGSSGCCLLP